MNAPDAESAKTNSTVSPPVDQKVGVGTHWWGLSIASVIVPWLSQPPLGWWPMALFAAIPFLIAATAEDLTRRRMLVLYLAATVYWATTLQGLRHANPLIYPCWITLAAYLAVYPILFVAAVRRLLDRGYRLSVIAPVAWVGMECVRNYLLTGISAAMLGHTLADVPVMIQIADLGGSYLVSLIVVVANVALFQIGQSFWARRRGQQDRRSEFSRQAVWSVAAALTLWAGAYAYGRHQLNQDSRLPSTNDAALHIALIGGNEPVEYDQDPQRELELFDVYAKESIRAIESSETVIDAVVWPESMFTGTMPWIFGEGGSPMAAANGLTVEEERLMIEEHQRRFQFRAASLQSMLARNNGPDQRTPQILGGCGIVDYAPDTRIYSGIVQIGADGNVADWYGKTHLVMFGEYIPLVKHLPIVKNWVPPNMGLTTGPGAKRFEIGPSSVCPNICIETAVERVAINHFRELAAADDGPLPDAIVTVTNDAWFDDSSVVQHHKRCAQFVAVACRRPVLSAANTGPAVWVDGCGRVVDEVPQGQAGSLVASPKRDGRFSLMLKIGDWPARVCAFVFLWGLLRRKGGKTSAE